MFHDYVASNILALTILNINFVIRLVKIAIVSNHDYYFLNYLNLTEESKYTVLLKGIDIFIFTTFKPFSIVLLSSKTCNILGFAIFSGAILLQCKIVKW